MLSVHVIVILSVGLIVATRGAPTIIDTDSQYSCAIANDVSKYLESGAGRLQVETAMARMHGVRDFDPFGGGAPPCIFVGTGWWAYELCWMRYLRQIHVEDHRIAAEYYLGLGPLSAATEDPFMSRMSAYVDGHRSPASQLEQLRGSREWQSLPGHFGKLMKPGDGRLACNHWVDAKVRMNRMAAATQDAKQGKRGGTSMVNSQAATSRVDNVISTVMTGGSICDVTGAPRKTLVVLTCEHESEFFVNFNVTEDAPCTYVVYVFGSAVCSTLRMLPLPDDEKPRIGHVTAKQQTSASHETFRHASAQAQPPTQKATPQASPGADAKPEPKDAATDGRIKKPSHYDRKGKEPGATKKSEKQSSADAESALARLLENSVDVQSAKKQQQQQQQPAAQQPGSSPNEAKLVRNDDEPPPYEGSLIFSLG